MYSEHFTPFVGRQRPGSPSYLRTQRNIFRLTIAEGKHGRNSSKSNTGKEEDGSITHSIHHKYTCISFSDILAKRKRMLIREHGF